MSWAGRETPRECAALLEEGRAIRRTSDVVRARALARARASLATPLEATPVLASPSHRFRIAAVAACAVLAGAAGAVAAVRGGMLAGVLSPPSAPSVPERRATPRAPVAPRATVPPPQPLLAPSEVPRPPRPVPTSAPHESYAAELALLHRAQATYAAQDYPGTVRLVAEHARRFPNGRLAEEREALRVRSLSRAGRTDEARRAVDEFSARFPRSVLLPRLKQTVGN